MYVFSVAQLVEPGSPLEKCRKTFNVWIRVPLEKIGMHESEPECEGLTVRIDHPLDYLNPEFGTIVQWLVYLVVAQETGVQFPLVP